MRVLGFALVTLLGSGGGGSAGPPICGDGFHALGQGGAAPVHDDRPDPGYASSLPVIINLTATDVAVSAILLQPPWRQDRQEIVGSRLAAFREREPRGWRLDDWILSRGIFESANHVKRVLIVKQRRACKMIIRSISQALFADPRDGSR